MSNYHSIFRGYDYPNKAQKVIADYEIEIIDLGISSKVISILQTTSKAADLELKLDRLISETEKGQVNPCRVRELFQS